MSTTHPPLPPLEQRGGNDLPRFEELVSIYLDGALTPEQEYELVQRLESPAGAQAFMEMLQINGEMAGLVSTPVADEKMAELVRKEINRKSNRESRVCSAIMDAIHREPARVDEVAFARKTPLITKPTTPWAMVISLGLHAALIALIVGMNLLIRVEPSVAPEISDDVLKPSSPLARVDSVNGDAYSIQNAEKHQARTGSDLAAGEALETVGKKSSADLRFTDGTVLMMSADTRVRQAMIERTVGAQVASGKRIFLDRGTLKAQVAKQPEGQPMCLVTPNAEATVVGTRFVLSSEPNETRLEVSEGIVKLTRLFDHKSVMVQAGEYAVVTPGLELTVNSTRKSGRLVMGVNFYGKPVNIEGNAWMSQSEAEARGLVVQVGPETTNSHIMNVTPVPNVDSQMRAMLNSRAYSMAGDMILTQPLPRGEYDVYLWLFEPAAAHSRTFDVELNGVVMERGAGKFKLGEWKKAGPYRSRSEDGKIVIRLKKVSGNPAISGMAIFAVDPSGN